MKPSLFSLLMISILLMAIEKPANAQYILTEADAQYELFNYSKAIDLYEQAYKKKASLHAASQLGASYALIQNYQQTESWYAIAVGMLGSKPENMLYYARALQNNSKYTEARAAYQQYALLDKTVTQAQQELWLRSCDSAVKWMKKPGAYIIKNEKTLNSPQSDWGAVKYGDVLVYTSDRMPDQGDEAGKSRPFLKFDGAKVPDRNIYGWTGNGYLRLYQNDGADSSTLFPLSAGTGYHVGPASFSADGKEMYFALTQVPERRVYIKGKLATVNVEIYSSKKDGTSAAWGKPIAFKYNKVNEWSVGDPYIAADGNTLYFTSNMPGGRGGTDIYVVHKTSDGDWGSPVNLMEVNTESNERSPSFDNNNYFYFSSDGYPGMGGLDIFKTANRGGKMDVPINMGYPVNSPQDDFAYNPGSENSGYLASNRTGGMGEDDIYSFMLQQALAFRLKGVAYDKRTKMPLNNTVVTLSKKEGGTLKVQTSADGAFQFNLEASSAYDLNGDKTGYRSDVASLTTVSLKSSAELQQDLYLEAIEVNKPIRLENIYYDFDKWNIRKDAAIELDKLVKVMQENPTIWIELGSHTDSRGNDAYNMILSQKRAESAVQYIINRGINKNRITAQGYGESQLLNRCANGVKCTPAEHQLNRRTEFKIVKQ